jgi:transposase
MLHTSDVCAVGNEVGDSRAGADLAAARRAAASGAATKERAQGHRKCVLHRRAQDRQAPDASNSSPSEPRFCARLGTHLEGVPEGQRIHLVLDNLSSHSENACIETFGKQHGRSLWRRFKVHFTPKHGSWLNAAEMEASLLSRQCIGKRRIPDLRTLVREVRAWRRVTTREGMPIRWRFRVKDARRTFRYERLESRRSND